MSDGISGDEEWPDMFDFEIEDSQLTFDGITDCVTSDGDFVKQDEKGYQIGEDHEIGKKVFQSKSMRDFL